MNFDDFNKNYDQIHNKNIKISGELSDYFTKYKVKVLNNFFLKNNLIKNLKILDIGCGIGKIERYLFSFFPKIEVYGIDPSLKSINEALSMNINSKASFLVYNGKKIPFKKTFFDVILFSCVLHHILPSKRQEILNESFRVLKKNGYLFVFEHNPFNPLTKYVTKTCIFDTDAQLLSKKVCANVLKNSGLSVAETKYIVFFPKILKFLRKFEKNLGRCPLGAQYFIAAQKINSNPHDQNKF